MWCIELQLSTNAFEVYSHWKRCLGSVFEAMENIMRKTLINSIYVNINALAGNFHLSEDSVCSKHYFRVVSPITISAYRQANLLASCQGAAFLKVEIHGHIGAGLGYMTAQGVMEILHRTSFRLYILISILKQDTMRNFMIIFFASNNFAFVLDAWNDQSLRFGAG